MWTGLSKSLGLRKREERTLKYTMLTLFKVNHLWTISSYILLILANRAFSRGHSVKTGRGRIFCWKHFRERHLAGRGFESGEIPVGKINSGVGAQYSGDQSRMALQQHALSLKHKPSANEKGELLERRRRLMVRITSFERKASTFLNLDDSTKWMSDPELDPGDDGDGEYSDDSDEEDVPKTHPEKQSLALPSSLAPGEINRLGLMDLARKESELRRGQVSEALEGLRMALGDKALFLRKDVRNMKSQKTSLKAWTNVETQDRKARQHRRAYNRARKALVQLNTDRDYLSTLSDITADQMKMPGDITEENRINQRSSTLPWFWRLGTELAIDEVEKNPRMMESEFVKFIIQDRVSWVHSLSGELGESQS